MLDRRDSRCIVNSVPTIKPIPRTWAMTSCSCCELANAALQLLATGDDVLHEAGLAHHFDRRQRRGATNCIAAVRTAVTAYRPLVVELATRAERGERKAAGDSLGHADDVGLDAVVLDGEHLAGATEPALHLVGDEHDPVLLASFDEARHERLRRRDVTTLAQHRLEDDGCGLVRRGHRLQQVIEALQRLGHRNVLVRCQWIRERRNEDAGRQGEVPGAISGLRCRHRHRHVCAAVEAAAEDDGVRALGDLLGQLDRSLGDLGARVRIEEGVDRSGESSLSLAANGSSRSCLYTLTCAWMNRCACSPMALATCG